MCVDWVFYTHICWLVFPYYPLYRLLDSLVVECWLRVREVPGSIPSQRPRHTKDVIKMVPVVPLLSTQQWRGKILALSQELRWENNDMDKIWDRNLSKSEVIGRCGGGEKPDRTDKSRALKKNYKRITRIFQMKSWSVTERIKLTSSRISLKCRHKAYLDNDVKERIKCRHEAYLYNVVRECRHET